MLAALHKQNQEHQASMLAALEQKHQQHQADVLVALQQQTQRQSAQNTTLEHRELELLRAERVQDGARYRDLMARVDDMMAMLRALRECASGLQEGSQQITSREKELQEKLGL